jgi:muconolactone delta-isomerase
MEFLVGFDVRIPAGTPESEVNERFGAEATAAAGLARRGRVANRVVYETYLVE